MKLTIEEAATKWSRTRRTIERWLETGKLTFERDPGGKRYITGVKEIKK